MIGFFRFQNQVDLSISNYLKNLTTLQQRILFNTIKMKSPSERIRVYYNFHMFNVPFIFEKLNFLVVILE